MHPAQLEINLQHALSRSKRLWTRLYAFKRPEKFTVILREFNWQYLKDRHQIDNFKLCTENNFGFTTSTSRVNILVLLDIVNTQSFTKD